jgi:predicted urease superfamily metal-dependent hydrolase
MSINKNLVDSLRRQLEQVAESAVRTLRELVEMGDSESVRLAAATKVLELVGVQPAREVTINVAEIDRVEDEMATTLERLQRNIEANQAKRELNRGAPSIEALIVLEGDDEELPVGGPIPGSTVIETTVGTV